MGDQADFDLFVIGGGVNGCGIARDAAGRGLRVGLSEMGDLGHATSSASTKLFHGGLRYLEYFEFRLVREALIEREILLRNMPHISWPMRFVLPLDPTMRFDGQTPTSKVLSVFMPWLRGRRPSWLIRLGLHLYDRLGRRQLLPASRSLRLAGTPLGAPLRTDLTRAFEYSDCWIDDSRLVVLNAVDARARGAKIRSRSKVVSARREIDYWRIGLADVQTGEVTEVTSRALANAGGPWVQDILQNVAGLNNTARIRLVRGSHIVTRKLFEHDQPYFLQGRDGRIIFMIPYEDEFTLIGTTDAEHSDTDTRPEMSREEEDYLLAFANTYLRTPISRADIVWRYSGVRPLYDDGASSATAATRDYVLHLDTNGAPMLNVFGGKITTYRRLAEAAVNQLSDALDVKSATWTHDAPLPGGDFALEDRDNLTDAIAAKYPFANKAQVHRMVRTYGTMTFDILGDAQSAADLGRDFGAGLTEAELTWLRDVEFAQTADDVLWRRTKLGLRLNEAQVAEVDAWMKSAGQKAA